MAPQALTTAAIAAVYYHQTMMQVCAPVAAVALLLSAAAHGQNIEVGPNVRVTDAGLCHVEPHIAANPQDARKLLVSVSHLERGSTIVETFLTVLVQREMESGRSPLVSIARATAGPSGDWNEKAADGDCNWFRK
jgi:hypothetical protein